MTGVYLISAVIITNSLMPLCFSHATRKGFHISRTCRPVCEPEKTCVIYKTSDGLARSVCVLVDPHQMVLDGTILVPLKKPLNSHKIPRPSTTDSVLQKQTLDDGNLIKPSQNDAVEVTSKTDYVLQKHGLDTGNVVESTQKDAFDAARMTATDNRPESILIKQLTALSQSLRHELLLELDSLGERTQNPDNKIVHNKSRSLNSVTDIPSSNSKTFDSRRDKLSGLFFVRDEKGRVVFRRVKQNSTERTVAENITPARKMEDEISTKLNIAHKKLAGNSSQTHLSTPAGLRKPPMNADGTNGFTDVLENGTVSCRSCDPDHVCPAGHYCYFSTTCAKQICQPL